MNHINIINLFNRPFIGAVIGDANSGKSNMIYHIIDELQNNYDFNLYVYGLRCEVKGALRIHSVEELEKIKDSVIFLDEFCDIFDLSDRRKKLQIERTLRLLFHNNNIIILGGLPENFKKFISAKINIIFYKQVTFDDFINGSRVKKNLSSYYGVERGSSVLNLDKQDCIIHDGKHYHRYDVPYIEGKDSKKGNVQILATKNVPEKVRGDD